VPQAYPARHIKGHGVFDLGARLEAVQASIFSRERRVALSTNRGLDVQVPRLAIWRRRVGHVPGLLWGGTFLPASVGRGHRHQKPHRSQPSAQRPAPSRALPNYEVMDSNHRTTHSTENALKAKRPWERKLRRGDPGKPGCIYPVSQTSW
jgi:hypothetical protein